MVKKRNEKNEILVNKGGIFSLKNTKQVPPHYNDAPLQVQGVSKKTLFKRLAPKVVSRAAS